jgi:hypothetical protein
MFDKKARQKLDWLEAQLKNWMAAHAAQGFQHECKRLHKDVEAERRRSFWHIISGETVQALSQRYEGLAKIALGLRELMQQAQPLHAEVEAVQALFRKEPTATADYGRKICNHWQSQLANIPSIAREAELQAAKHKLPAIESALRLHAEALRAFQEVDEVLKNVRQNTDCAVLENALRMQREALSQGQLSLADIEALKSRSKPLEALSKRPEPPELKLVSNALTEIHRWSRALGLAGAEESALEQRHQQMEDEWRRRDEAELKQLAHDAQALRASRIRQAFDERESKLGQLQKAYSDLRMACGAQPEIEESLAALQHERCDRANEHSAWLEKFHKAQEIFKAIASHHDLDLENRLDQRCADWKARLQALQAMPLAQSLRQAANLSQQALNKLNEGKNGQELLLSLREADERLMALENLERQAEADRAGFDQARKQLREDNAALQSHAAKAGLACENLQPAIQALGEDAHNPDLDEALAKTRALELQLDDLRQGFIHACQAALEQGLEESARLRDSLCSAGFAAQAPKPPAGRRPASAEQCAEQLAAQAAWRLSLEQALAEALGLLRQRCGQEQEKLSGLLSGGTALEMEYRERAQALLERLQEGAHAASDSQRLLEWARLLGACASLWGDLGEAEEKLQAWLAKLKQQLHVFSDERLKDHCSAELLEQAADWVRGMPKQPQKKHALQLQEADTLLRRLERHARRQVAEEIRQQRLELAQIKHRHPDPDGAARLLAEIERIGHDAPPPYEFRKQLAAALNAARSQANG